jgi:hypothetical protein
MWSFLKARWVWGRGRCPLCGRPFSGRPAPQDGHCGVCRGATDDLSIWRNFRACQGDPKAVRAARV